MKNLTSTQQTIINEKKSCFIIGAAGTGKTVTLVEKVATLVESTPPAEQVFIALFSYRSYLIVKKMLEKRLEGTLAQKVNIGTLRDFAVMALENGEEAVPVKFVSDTIMRRCLRQAMRESNFSGTAVEAEYIIRQFKSKARKPTGKEEHYLLMSAYKDIMDKGGLTDRYDIIRQHIIGMRDNSLKPLPIKHLLVDNIQDATRIQLLWIFDHVKNGAVLTASGCDDLCIFTRDGAVGSEAFAELRSQNIKKYCLEQSFRTPSPLGEAVEAIVAPIKSRMDKMVKFTNKPLGVLSIEQLSSVEEEINACVKRVTSIAKGKTNIGIITRSDIQAGRITRVLKAAEIKHSSLAQNIWHVPGAIMILDLLCLLLNQAETRNLGNVLLGYGIKHNTITNLFEAGLQSREWLKNSAPMPQNTKLPVTILAECGTVQRTLLGHYKLMAERKTSPQEVFKSCAYDLLKNMNKEDRQAALIALQDLLDLKNDLLKTLTTIREWEQPSTSQLITVAPVREVRNMEFDYVIMPFASSENYPYNGYNLLPKDMNLERRFFYMAASRAKKGLYITYSGKPSAIIHDLKKWYKV